MRACQSQRGPYGTGLVSLWICVPNCLVKEQMNMSTCLSRVVLFVGFSLAAALVPGCGSSAAFHCGDLKDDGVCGEYDDSFASLKTEILTNCRTDKSAIAGDGPCPRQNAIASCTSRAKDASCGTSCGYITSLFYTPQHVPTKLEALRASCSQLGGSFSTF